MTAKFVKEIYCTRSYAQLITSDNVVIDNYDASTARNIKAIVKKAMDLGYNVPENVVHKASVTSMIDRTTKKAKECRLKRKKEILDKKQKMIEKATEDIKRKLLSFIENLSMDKYRLAEELGIIPLGAELLLKRKAFWGLDECAWVAAGLGFELTCKVASEK
jgi:hypothetical protein